MCSVLSFCSQCYEQKESTEHATFPSFGRMLLDQARLTNRTAQELDASFEEDYKHLQSLLVIHFRILVREHLFLASMSLNACVLFLHLIGDLI